MNCSLRNQRCILTNGENYFFQIVNSVFVRAGLFIILLTNNSHHEQALGSSGSSMRCLAKGQTTRAASIPGTGLTPVSHSSSPTLTDSSQLTTGIKHCVISVVVVVAATLEEEPWIASTTENHRAPSHGWSPLLFSQCAALLPVCSNEITIIMEEWASMWALAN